MELHNTCLELSDRGQATTFLSVTEGKLFRNCINKFNVLFPAMKANIQYADCRATYEQTYLETQKRFPELKKLEEDPWAAERDRLLTEYY